MPKRTDPEKVAEVCALYDKGHTYSAISEKTGVPKGTVNNIIVRHNKPSRYDIGRTSASRGESTAEGHKTPVGRKIQISLQSGPDLRISRTGNEINIVNGSNNSRLVIGEGRLEELTEVLMTYLVVADKV